MSAPRFTAVTARAALLGANDVDTNEIVPARFLKVTDKVGLGDALFSDFRPGFAAEAAAAGAAILVAGKNFGCGSSREHAPWALVAAGFRAVIARDFADIFRGNALKNGLIPVALGDDAHAALIAALAGDPAAPITVDLESCTVELGELRAGFAVDGFARRCLLDGVDELGYLLSRLPRIAAYEASHQDLHQASREDAT